MPCVGQGGLSRVGRTQPPTQASPVTSSVTLQVSDNVGLLSLVPSLIPGMCQPCMEQLQALPHAPGDRCGVTCWNLLLPGGIWAEESWHRAGSTARGDVLWWEH